MIHSLMVRINLKFK